MESSRGGEEAVHIALVVFEQQSSVLHEEAEHDEAQPYGALRRACRLELRGIRAREGEVKRLLLRTGECDHLGRVEDFVQYRAVERHDSRLGRSAVGCLVRHVEDGGFQRLERYRRSGLQTKRTVIDALNIYGDCVGRTHYLRFGDEIG